jgi:ABC-type Fe3+-siderophore transport system permease subunit
MKRIKNLLKKIFLEKYVELYFSDRNLRARISLYLSCLTNTFFVLFYFVAAIYYKSFWQGAMSIYYLALSSIRFMLSKRANVAKKKNNQMKYELKTYRTCGIFMFFINCAMTGLVAQMIWQNKSYEYAGILIYAEATYTFYCFITAIINVVKFKKSDSPIISASKMIALARAVMSLFALQTAMFCAFDSGNYSYQRVMNTVFGAIACTVVFAFAIAMIIDANKKLKNFND